MSLCPTGTCKALRHRRSWTASLRCIAAPPYARSCKQSKQAPVLSSCSSASVQPEYGRAELLSNCASLDDELPDVCELSPPDLTCATCCLCSLFSVHGLILGAGAVANSEQMRRHGHFFICAIVLGSPARNKPSVHRLAELSCGSSTQAADNVQARLVDEQRAESRRIAHSSTRSAPEQ